MFGHATFRRLWVLLVVAVLPILVSSIAAAAPGYPVQDPPGATYTVAYEPSSHVLSVTNTTPDPTVAVAPEAAEGVVDVVSGEVVGPNGQVNHGQVMKQLHDLIDGNDVGCITSAVAQSEFGKGDQQVQPKDTTVTPDSGALDPATLDPTIVDIDCTTRGGQSDEHPSNNATKEHTTGQPDSPGKSDTAPRTTR
jgi:hypothetical protein